MTPGFKVPFYGLDRQFASCKNEFLGIIDKVLSTGTVLQGPRVEEFEEKMAKLCNRKYARAVGSCTDALTFALISCGVKPGDEVLVTAFSFVASLSPILRVGARPVFVDIEPDYFMMDIKDAKKKITPKTRFLIAVHLFGQCLPMPEIETFARKHDLKVIEDAAQAMGSSYNHRPAGSLGEVSCLSFDPTKVLGAFGSGGVALTDSEKIAGEVGRLRYHGKDRKTADYQQLGYNSQLSCESAALLSFKADRMAKWAEKRNEIAGKYMTGLKDVSGVILPKIGSGSTHNWHKFVLRLLRRGNRDKTKKFLENAGIQTMIHYPQVLCDIPYLREYGCDGQDAPVARKVSQDVLSLPIYPELAEEEVLHVISNLNRIKAQAIFNNGDEV